MKLMLAKMMIMMKITTITVYTITCTCRLQVQFSIVKRLPYKKLWLPWHLFTITLNAKLTVMVKCYTQYWKIQNEVYLNEINLTWSLFILGLCLCGSLMEWSLSRQLATCVEILITRYILHSPWQPKQSQLVALNC